MSFKSTLSSIGTGISKGLTALEEAAERANEREQGEKRADLSGRIYAIQPSLVIKLENEDLDTLISVVETYLSDSKRGTVRLDATGHLPNCRPHCSTKHCLDCGDSVIGTSSPYCWTCR